MRVKIETSVRDIGALLYQARMLNGYRAGELIVQGTTDIPLRWVDRAQFVTWLQETGYEVVNVEE